MWTDTQHDWLGSEDISSGSPIPVKRPSDWDFPDTFYPLISDNIRFDTINGWQIFQGGSGKLPEGTNFNYNSDLEVKATWWKKINTVIFSATNAQQTNIDLDSHVHVQTGHQDSGVTTDRYAFFGGDETVLFKIDGEREGTRIIEENGNTYTFLFWTYMTPQELENLTSRITLDTRDMSYPVARADSQANRFINCLYNETAYFMEGTNVTIIVRTNDSGSTHTWNNTPKIQFEVVWLDDAQQTVTSVKGPSPFDSGTVPHDNPINVAPENVGHFFYVRPYIDSVSWTDPEWIEPNYQFRGWYYGDFNGHEEDFMPSQLPNNDPAHYYTNNSSYIHGNYETPVFCADRQFITLTMIYSKSTSQQYTITYYSGIGN